VGGSDTRGPEAVSGMRDWVNFAEIRNQVKLAAVLHAYGVDWLRHSGPPQQYRGRCPIHHGQGTEAFHAHLGRGVFHCFACGAGGNVLDFVAAMEGCSVREAALRLQGPHGQTGRPTGAPASSRPRRRELVTKKREINPPLSFALDVDGQHPYLARRGMDSLTVDHFGVGYYGARGLMQGRIAVPIHDDQGRLVAYCGRALGADAPRYRFPAGFQKAQVLFNYHRALATREQQVIVVEGFFDCMRVHQAGYPCVVALMGARLSAMQKDLLTDRFRNVVLLLDGDPTGRSAMEQIAGDLALACAVTKVLLPPDLQPDQMAAADIRYALTGEERRQEIDAIRPI
jgi:DNA primase